MQPNYLGRFSLVEMAADSIAHFLAKFLQSLGFSEDRFTKGTSCKSAFGRFLNDENQFVHDLATYQVGGPLPITFDSTLPLIRATGSLECPPIRFDSIERILPVVKAPTELAGGT